MGAWNPCRTGYENSCPKKARTHIRDPSKTLKISYLRHILTCRIIEIMGKRQNRLSKSFEIFLKLLSNGIAAIIWSKTARFSQVSLSYSPSG